MFDVNEAVAPCAISKAGVIQMTEALALEWARYGIQRSGARVLRDRTE